MGPDFFKIIFGCRKLMRGILFSLQEESSELNSENGGQFMNTLTRTAKFTNSHSYFLFGARGVGKSTLLRTLYPKDQHLWFDLLDSSIYPRLLQNPSLFKTMILDKIKNKTPQKTSSAKVHSTNPWIIVDEIQKLPELLDSVHSLMEEYRVRFILTGSSARKLKQAGVNLLAGRAFVYKLFPFTYIELEDSFSLNNILRFGSLPKIFQLESDQDKIEYLNAYTDTYLKEEVLSEQLIRNVKPFRLFLNIAAQSNGKILNFSKIARDIQVDPNTVQSYFQILEDTLVGYFLEPYHESIRKRQRNSSKFYFFDLGIQRALNHRLEIPLTEHTYDYGEAFEHFLILETLRMAEYHRKKWKFSYLRSKDGAEIDLIIERPGQKKVLIKIKSSTQISNLSDSNLKGFMNLSKDIKNSEAYIFSQDPIQRKEKHLQFYYWKDGLDHLFS